MGASGRSRGDPPRGDEVAPDGERHSPGHLCLLAACSGVSVALLVGLDSAVECRIVGWFYDTVIDVWCYKR